MLLAAYGSKTMSCTHVSEWFKRIKEGMSVENDDVNNGNVIRHNDEMIIRHK